jgi:hypothetical protein
MGRLHPDDDPDRPLMFMEGDLFKSKRLVVHTGAGMGTYAIPNHRAVIVREFMLCLYKCRDRGVLERALRVFRACAGGDGEWSDVDGEFLHEFCPELLMHETYFDDWPKIDEADYREDDCRLTPA